MFKNEEKETKGREKRKEKNPVKMGWKKKDRLRCMCVCTQKCVCGPLDMLFTESFIYCISFILAPL